jgi:hypothetical protein
MTQLSLESDARKLIGVLSTVLELPDGAARAYLALATILDSPDDPASKQTRERFTTIQEIKNRIFESHYSLLEKFGYREIHLAELKLWYKESFRLYPADFSATKGNNDCRWSTQFNNALRGSTVIFPVRRFWYRINPA